MTIRRSGTVAALVYLFVAGISLAGVCDGVSEVNNATLTRIPIVTGLTQPLLVTAPPGDTDRLFIVEQPGRIKIWKRGDPSNVTVTFLDISTRVNNSGNERGLLGMAFDPNYATNGLFYVNYTATAPAGGTSGDTVVARYEVVPGFPDNANPQERVLMVIDQPESNHNGGALAFGPDGFLYIGVGDGGGGGDTHGCCGNGQNIENPLGKLLRIDPSLTEVASPDCGSGLYRVPAGNPFLDGAGGDCDEIWAYGLRNPWRFSFDSETGDLYIADVGQNAYEEVNYLSAAANTGGQNYGWRLMEGDNCYGTGICSAACGSLPACNDPSFTYPIKVAAQAPTFVERSITGGFVYRGCRMPGFNGTYFYGDYQGGTVRSFEVNAGVRSNDLRWSSLEGGLAGGLTSFGEDAQGEIYFMDRSPGAVYKIVPPLADLEVSGFGAQFMLMGDGSNWSWEDLGYTSMYPIDYYNVYRSGSPTGTFSCIFSTATPDWFAGDLAVPGVSELFAYVVTAVDGGLESSGGGSRTLTNPCAAP